MSHLTHSPFPYVRRARKISTMELGVLQEVPVFRPTEKEFSDPLRYIEKIRPEAEQYGLCRVVPPPGFKVWDYAKDSRGFELRSVL